MDSFILCSSTFLIAEQFRALSVSSPLLICKNKKKQLDFSFEKRYATEKYIKPIEYL